MFGVSQQLLIWDHEMTEFTLAVHKFITGFQKILNFDSKLQLKAQGFHYNTRSRSIPEVIVTVLPLKIVENSKK